MSIRINSTFASLLIVVALLLCAMLLIEQAEAQWGYYNYGYRPWGYYRPWGGYGGGWGYRRGWGK